MTTTPAKSIDFSAIKEAAAGRWHEILPALTPLPAEVLRKAGTDHPCPVCDGRSTIWPADDAETTGRIACRKCTKDKLTGDGIATIAAFAECEQGEAARLVAKHLGLDATEKSNSKKKTADHETITAVCNAKRMPEDAFKKFGVKPAIRNGAGPVARVRVFDHTGRICGHFDISPDPKNDCHKGKFGLKSYGVFLPLRKPKPGESWLLVEGVKDASALVGLGYPNVCGQPGAWLPSDFAAMFSGCEITIVCDLDQAGRDGAIRSAEVLAPVAKSVKWSRLLPGPVPPTKGQDVRDILAEPGGEKTVRDAIDNPEEIETLAAGDGPPAIVLTLDLQAVADKTVKAVGKLASVYQRGGGLVEILSDAEPVELPGGIVLPAGSPRIRPIPKEQLPLRITTAARLLKETETELKPAAPPPWLTAALATRGDYGRAVRRLDGIARGPTLRADGSILQAPGYDPASRLLCMATPGAFPPIPEFPTREEVNAAAAMLLGLVADFPFEGDTDRAAWLALVLTLAGRPAIAGCVPIWLFTATTPGSGKTLLATLSHEIVHGSKFAARPYPTADDELRKVLACVALEGLPAALFDNLGPADALGGSALDAASTSEVWTDRILGRSETFELPWRTVLVATGNNCEIQGDISRRLIVCRLKPDTEFPEERDGFDFPDLPAHVREHRPQLLAAALTILRGYIAAGSPPQPGGRMGSFEKWAGLVRGAIVWAGIGDPLAGRAEIKDNDPNRAKLAGMVAALRDIGTAEDGITAREIAETLLAPDEAGKYTAARETLAELGLMRGGAVDPRRLAAALRQLRGRLVSLASESEGEPPTSYRIESKVGHNKTQRWSLIAGGGGGCGGSVSNPSHEKRDNYSPDAPHVVCEKKLQGPKVQPPLPPQPPPGDPLVCEHEFHDTREGGTIKTTCRRCGKFRGRRPASQGVAT